MPEQLQTTDDKLTIRRTYDTSPQKVYEAFVTKGLLERWYAPGDMKAEVRTLDATIGGGFEIAMHESGGAQHVCYGTFQELVPGKRIVHSFGWRAFPDRGEESLVTVEITAKGAQTEVRFTHERLANKESVEQHAEGWNGCLDNLVRVL